MAPPLPRAAILILLPLLLASVARSQPQEVTGSPVSQPPASDAPTSSPLPSDSAAADTKPAHSPISKPPTTSAAAVDSPPQPAPETSPTPAPSDSPHPHHSFNAAPAPAPGADEDKDEEEDDDDRKAPAPAPAAEEIKASSAAEQAVGDSDGKEGHEEMNGGKKAGVVVGAFTAAAVVGLGCFVWRKRRANIRRARYADYAARLELV